MINLLSITDKKRIKNIYRCRLIEWYSLLLAFLLIVLLFLAGCLYFIIALRASTEQSILDSLQIKGGDGSKTEQISVADINKAIALMMKTSESSQISDLINTLASQKSAGVRITDLKFAHTEAGETTIDLKGITTSRQTLLDFISLLQGISGFHDVNSPYSNLVKKTNAEFDVSLEVAKVKIK